MKWKVFVVGNYKADAITPEPIQELKFYVELEIPTVQAGPQTLLINTMWQTHLWEEIRKNYVTTTYEHQKYKLLSTE